MSNDEIALQLAQKALKKGFDPEAYIVQHIAEQRIQKEKEQDLVPDSNIDECIQLMLKLFVSYFNTPSIENMNKYLLIQKQVLSELYHTANDDCKSEMKTFFNELNTII